MLWLARPSLNLRGVSGRGSIVLLPAWFSRRPLLGFGDEATRVNHSQPRPVPRLRLQPHFLFRASRICFASSTTTAAWIRVVQDGNPSLSRLIEIDPAPRNVSSLRDALAVQSQLHDILPGVAVGLIEVQRAVKAAARMWSSRTIWIQR